MISLIIMFFSSFFIITQLLHNQHWSQVRSRIKQAKNTFYWSYLAEIFVTLYWPPLAEILLETYAHQLLHVLLIFIGSELKFAENALFESKGPFTCWKSHKHMIFTFESTLTTLFWLQEWPCHLLLIWHRNVYVCL